MRVPPSVPSATIRRFTLNAAVAAPRPGANIPTIQRTLTHATRVGRVHALHRVAIGGSIPVASFHTFRPIQSSAPPSNNDLDSKSNPTPNPNPTPSTSTSTPTSNAFRARTSSKRAKLDSSNSNFLNYLIGLTVLVLGASWAAVPLYRAFCAHTGYGGTTQTDKDGSKLATLKAGKREVIISFNADVSPAMHWKFIPSQRDIKVRLGEPVLAFYKATNLRDKAITGVATYNVTPQKTGSYFHKIQCFCIAAGSKITGIDGLATKIEDTDPLDMVMAYRENENTVNGCSPDTSSSCEGLVPGRKVALTSMGVKPCVTLELEDGRTLECTPDHRVLTTKGWMEARHIPINDPACRVLVGAEGVLDEVAPGDSTFSLELPHSDVTLNLGADRKKVFAFVRLLGRALASDHMRQQSLNQSHATLQFGHPLDAESAIRDLELLGQRPTVHDATGVTSSNNAYQLTLGESLSRDLRHFSGSCVDRRTDLPPQPLPLAIMSAPKCVKREFLGAYFGSDGGAPSLSLSEDGAEFEEVQFSMAVAEPNLAVGQAVLSQLQTLLGEFGIATDTINRCANTKSDHRELRLQLSDTAQFADAIGFRYCCNNLYRLTVAASWHRMQRGHTYSPVHLLTWLESIGAGSMFAHSSVSDKLQATNAVSCDRDSLPVLCLKLANRAATETPLATYDISVDKTHSFLANGIVVHNCFDEQRLRANETVDMPVFFYIDPAMEDDIRCQDVTHLTLSYTFWPVEEDEDDTRTEEEKDAQIGVRFHGTGVLPLDFYKAKEESEKIGKPAAKEDTK